MLKKLGQVYVFGDNSNGQLGLPYINQLNRYEKIILDVKRVDTQVLNNKLKDIVQIEAGKTHSLVLSSNGKVFICGKT